MPERAVNEPEGPDSASARPAFAAKDALVAVGLATMLPIAWLVPEPAWGAAARRLIPAVARLTPGGAQATIRHIERLVAGHPVAAAPEAIYAEGKAAYLEEQLQLLREYRPGGWRPEIRLEGEEHVRAALARGSGVVLWVGYFCFYSLVSKIAMHRAGVALSHLSHERHGFSATRFGVRVLNPVRSRVECRYVRERVVFADGGATAALRALRRRLAENGAVSIAARAGGQKPVEVPFLNERIGLATGAPDLAFAGGAPLLPMFTVREPDGGFRVVIEPPIAFPAAARRREAVEEAVALYARRLEPFVLRYPGQWRGWFHLEDGT